MGGAGSGNWFRIGAKSTVEDSLVVSVRTLRGRLFAGAAGTLTWTWTSGGTASVGYSVVRADDPPVVTFCYRLRSIEEVAVPVRLTSTPAHFGGERWWFTCPLAVRGLACGRRAGKLYLPPGGRYFGCRRCHDLTYRSCQEAHQAERAFARLGFGPDIARQWAAEHRRGG